MTCHGDLEFLKEQGSLLINKVFLEESVRGDVPLAVIRDIRVSYISPLWLSPQRRISLYPLL